MSNRDSNNWLFDISGGFNHNDLSNSYIPPLSINDLSHNLQLAYLEICKEIAECNYDDITYTNPMLSPRDC
jgi:hypothetical protein